jgi:hypothetical protein
MPLAVGAALNLAERAERLRLVGVVMLAPRLQEVQLQEQMEQLILAAAAAVQVMALARTTHLAAPAVPA